MVVRDNYVGPDQCEDCGLPCNPYGNDYSATYGNSRWDICLYPINTSFIKPYSSVETEYNPNHILTKSTIYDHNDLGQVIETAELKSDGSHINTYFNHPYELSSDSTIDEMISYHFYNPLIHQQEYSVGNGTKKTMDLTYNYEKYAMGDTIINFVPGRITQFFTDSSKSQSANYKYNPRGSQITEAYRDDGMHTSVIWGYGETYPIAKVNNAEVNAVAYSNFETGNDKGNWTYSGDPDFSQVAHTGKGCYLLSNHSITKNLDSSEKYTLEYWSKGTVTLSAGSEILSSSDDPDGWAYHKYEISSSSDITISGSTYIDDLRLYPADAQMVTYTYQPNIGITSQTDESNVTTYYEYDNFGRLKFIIDQEGNVLQTYEYHYKNPDN